MNTSEQKKHTRVTDELQDGLTYFAEATADHFTSLERDLRELIGSDLQLRECCQERWDATAEAQGNILRQIGALRDRNFLGRMRWLFRGI